jgi:hypothetical protein
MHLNFIFKTLSTITLNMQKDFETTSIGIKFVNIKTLQIMELKKDQNLTIQFIVPLMNFPMPNSHL